MLNRRSRILFVLIAVLLVISWCATRSASAQDRAKPRSKESGQSAEKKQKDSAGKERYREQEKRDRSRERDKAEQRHPRPDRYDRYHWNNYRSHGKPRVDRFPRYYRGRHLFSHRSYHGRPFGPHHRFRYYYRGSYAWIYWPYFDEPRWGCDWYWVPYQRILVTDPETGEQYWEYWDYRYRYICFD